MYDAAAHVQGTLEGAAAGGLFHCPAVFMHVIAAHVS